MNWTIFLRELRVGLTQGAASAVPAIGIVVAARWLRPADDFSDQIGLFPIAMASLAVLLWIMGFGSGARTFALEDRRDQWLFWYSLPVSRNSMWLSMVGARMVAALLSIGLLLIAFLLSDLPSLLPEWSHARMELLSLVLSLCATIFAAGCCVSLVVRRTLLIHVAGLALLWVLLYPTARLVLLFGSGESPAKFDMHFLAALFLLIATVLSFLSWLFFRYGELHVWKRRAVNQGILVVALASTLLLIRMITRPPLLDFVAGPWIQSLLPSRPGGAIVSFGTERLVSLGGRYLVVVESLEKRLGYSRVSIIETATSRLVRQRRWNDLEWVSWEGREQVLRIFSEDSDPFRKVSSGAMMHRVTPEIRVLSRSRFELRPDLMALQDGSDLLFESRQSEDRLLQLAEPERLRVLMKLPGVIARSTQPLRGQGAFVFFKRRIDQPWNILHIERGMVREVHDKEAIFRSPSQINLEKRLGRPAFEKALQTPDLFYSDPRLVLSLPDSLALYLRTDGGAVLYDGTLDREILLPACNGRAASPEMIPNRNNLAFLVRIQCGDATPRGEAARHRHFYYLPGSGMAKPIPALDRIMGKSPDLLAYLDEQTVIWREGETWKSLRQGQLRILWPERAK